MERFSLSLTHTHTHTHKHTHTHTDHSLYSDAGTTTLSTRHRRSGPDLLDCCLHCRRSQQPNSENSGRRASEETSRVTHSSRPECGVSSTEGCGECTHWGWRTDTGEEGVRREGGRGEGGREGGEGRGGREEGREIYPRFQVTTDCAI